MESQNKVNNPSSVIRPTDQIIIKFSISAPNIDESLTSTVFSLEEIHEEKIDLDEEIERRIVLTFRYINPKENPDPYYEFDIKISDNINLSQVSTYFQLYMPLKMAKTLTDYFEKGISMSYPMLGMTVFMPEEIKDNLKFEEEHWIVIIKDIRTPDNMMCIDIVRTENIKKEIDVMEIVKSVAKNKDMLEVHQLFNQYSESVLEKNQDVPLNPVLLSNTPEEMVEKMLDIERLGGGYVKFPQEPNVNITLAITKSNAEKVGMLMSSVING